MLLLICPALLILVFPLAILGQRASTTVLEHRWNSQPLAAGTGGKLQMELSVKDGFKVAKQPAPKLQVSPNSSFEVSIIRGFVENAQGKDPGYFGRFRPVELKVVPEKTIKNGKYSLEAKLTYFYCSEIEKYCSRSVENLTIPLEVMETK